MGFLRRNLKYCPQECKKTSYISLVHSTMEYGGIIWDPYTETNINRLERIQRQAARFITGDYRSREEGSVSNMLVKLELKEWLRGWFLLLNQMITRKKHDPRDLSLLKNLRTTMQLRIDRNFCSVHEETTWLRLFRMNRTKIAINPYKLIQTFFALILKNTFIFS